MPPSSPRRHLPAAASILVAAVTLLAAAPSLAAPPSLPAINTPPGQEHHTGKTIFVQLVTPDLATSEAFYTGLLGWQFEPIPNTRVPYAAALSSGNLVGGVAQRAIPAGQHLQSAWLGFFSVSDVNAAVTLAAAQGAKTLAAPHDVPGLGREAVLADPQGAVFGILASSSGDPPDILSPVGTWIWRSLLTTDPTSDAAFYNTVLGFNATPFPSEGAAQHLLLVSGTYARRHRQFLARQPPRHAPPLAQLRPRRQRRTIRRHRHLPRRPRPRPPAPRPARRHDSHRRRPRRRPPRPLRVGRRRRDQGRDQVSAPAMRPTLRRWLLFAALVASVAFLSTGCAAGYGYGGGGGGYDVGADYYGGGYGGDYGGWNGGYLVGPYREGYGGRGFGGHGFGDHDGGGHGFASIPGGGGHGGGFSPGGFSHGGGGGGGHGR